MLTCQKLTQLVTDYLEDALPMLTRQELQAHLANCDRCRAHLDAVRATIKCLGRLPPEPIAEDVKAKLLQCFRDSMAGGDDTSSD